MRGFLRAGLLAIGLVLVLFFSPITSAYTISAITIEPKGDLVPCLPVTMNFTISNPPSNLNEDSGAADIVMETGLPNPVWSLTLVADGEERVFPGKQKNHVLLSEWGLAGFNRNAPHEKIRISLAGEAPEHDITVVETLITVSQLGADNKSIAGSDRSAEAVVASACCGSTSCNPAYPYETELATFGNLLRKTTAHGADTSNAKTGFARAQHLINYARAMPKTEYEHQLSVLKDAGETIAMGERMLDKAWAEKVVEDAQVPINNVDPIIAWFKGNASTRDDAQLPAIITKREVAMSYISTAKDQIGNGNYEQARAMAQDAFNKGNESYTDALRRRSEVHEHTLWDDWFAIPPPCKCGGIFLVFYLALVVVIIGIKIAILIIPILGVYYLFRKWRGAKPE